jgi:catechol 2,3-dioxygenase-like lactoylglutathione lyase family enzyme
MSTDRAVGSRELIRGGSPTIFVSDLDRSVEFYTTTLGLSLKYRAGEHFAMIDAGSGLLIGLHPPSRRAAAPGTMGCVQIGLNVTEPIEQVVQTLRSRGVVFQERGGRTVIDDGGAVKLAFFNDPDGTELYVCEVIRGG